MPSLSSLVTSGLFSMSVTLFIFCHIYSFVLFFFFIFDISDNLEYLSLSA